jgi:hypothetical protein
MGNIVTKNSQNKKTDKATLLLAKLFIDQLREQKKKTLQSSELSSNSVLKSAGVYSHRRTPERKLP